MTIKTYIHTIGKQLRDSEDKAERRVLRTKFTYAMAYRKGTLDEYRNRAIEREMGKIYARSATDNIGGENSAENKAYQAFRAKCEAKVDQEMASLKAEIERTIEQPSA